MTSQRQLTSTKEVAASVSVIVVTWNQRDLLRECLESLVRQTFQRFEIIVVDNGSTDGSRELVRERFSNVRLITLPENCGFAVGNNIGIQHAQGNYVALLNNDAVAEPGWLQALVSAIEQDPDLGSCASKMLFYDQRDRINSTGILYSTLGVASDLGWMTAEGPPFDVPAYILGACAGAALYKKSMLEDIGLFDEEFSPAYLEDADLSLRAQLRGYRCLYVPSAIVYHRVAATLGYGSSAAEYLTARNRLYTVVKNIPARLLLKYGPPMLTCTFFQFCARVSRGRGSAYFRGVLSAGLKLPRILRKRYAIQQRRLLSVTQFEALMAKQTISSLIVDHLIH